MNTKRREFLKLSAGLVAGAMLTPIVGEGFSLGKKSFGIQLWTVREDMDKDPKGTLKKLADFGYTYVESFEGKQGLWWGMSASDFKKYLTDIGLTIHSAHCNITQNMEQKAEQAATIGVTYLICPWLGPQKSIDDFSKYADQFNQLGTLCKKAGIQFAYHNHDYSFKVLDGKIPQDVMMQNTDASLVDFEMDMYWVVTAGEDPIQWIKKYPNRFRLAHVKDRIKNATDTSASCILGKGSIDYKNILKNSSRLGMKYFIVEQERFDNTTPLDSSNANAQFMNSLKF